MSTIDALSFHQPTDVDEGDADLNDSEVDAEKDAAAAGQVI